MIKNIKAILFDLDNTIMDFKECEKQSLEYLFKNIGEKYKKEYHEIFSEIDRDLWRSVSLNISNIQKEKIPEYRFEIFFNKIYIKYNDYGTANKLFQEKFKQECILIDNAEEVITYLYNKNYDEENTTGSFSWDLRIEYKNGTIEVHSGDGIGSAPKGFYDIKASLDNIIE